MSNTLPQSGCWYRMPDWQTFRVVAAENDDCIRIQYLDGACECVERTLWHQLQPQTLESPPAHIPLPPQQCDNLIDFEALEVAPGTEARLLS